MRANRWCLTAGLVAAAVAVWPGVALAASTISGTVTFDGKVPGLKPLSMDADPTCAKMHAKPAPNEMLVLGSGNTMGNIMVWVSKGLPEGKTWPVPKAPGGARSEGLHIRPARDGNHGRPDLQDPQLRRHPPQRPRPPQDQPGIQPADAADAQGDERDVRQAGAGLPDQVRRAPVDERLRRRVHAIRSSRSRNGREVHDLRPRPGDLRDHGLARAAGNADSHGHGRRRRNEDAGLQVHHACGK
jgi:hypothetical protein